MPLARLVRIRVKGTWGYFQLSFVMLS
jgi:hypothetical protein